MESAFDIHSEQTWTELGEFFNHHHDKILCTASATGEPNAAFMGTPRLKDDGRIEFEITDLVSISLQNMQENKAVVFIGYVPGPRARDYTGARIYATVTGIETQGEKYEKIKQSIRERFGEEKASELHATITCMVTNARPIIDRGQAWNRLPYPNG